MSLKIILCLIILCGLIVINCDDEINKYTICDNDTGNEILSFATLLYQPTVIVTCFNFDALNHIGNITKQLVVKQSKPAFGVIFVNCFNNETDHDNYRYFKLQTLLNKIGQKKFGYFDLKFENDGVGLANDRVFYGDFSFSQYNEIYIWYVKCLSSTYLGSVYNGDLSLRYISHVDFNDFLYNTISQLELVGNTISNFTRENLSKFITVQMLSVINFAFDDCDALNVPNLFEQNTNLQTLEFVNSTCSIRVHEKVFMGIHELMYLTLDDLQLETIPTSLLHDLPKLVGLSLQHNNIKHMDPETFHRTEISAKITLGGTGMFSTKHTVHFELPGDNFLLVNNENIYDYQAISSLVINNKVTTIIFFQCNFEYFDLSDFNEITNRAKPIRIDINNSNIKLSLAWLRLRRINYETNVLLSKQQLSKLNALIYINFSELKWSCPQCIFDLETFMMQLNGKLENFNLYLIEPNTIIYVSLLKEFDLIRQYSIGNTENCPAPCRCIFIPLLDELLIDCADRLLTEIPIIPYTPQIDRIDSIEFLLQNNLLTKINFANQDDRVVERLQFVNFMNQTITRIELDINQNHFRLTKYCREWDRQERVNETNTTMAEVCGLSVAHPKNSFQYMMKNKPMNSVVQILRSFACDSKCY